MFVRNWMSSPAIPLGPDVTASAALAFMEKRRVRRLPVVQDGKLVGIVTKSDLMGAGRQHAVSRVTTLSNIMTRNPLTVQVEDTLEAAALLMMSKKISGVPVMEGGELVGIITESDLFRALSGMLGIGEKGARVILTVPEDADLLQSIRSRLNDLTVRSLVTVHDPKRKVWDVVMRVRGRLSTKTP